MAMRVFTGNRVRDGRVIYLGRDGSWTEDIAESRLIDDAHQAEAEALAERATADAVVADPYLIDVTIEAGIARPVRYRERIRAYGPSIHPQFSKLSAAVGAPEGDTDVPL